MSDVNIKSVFENICKDLKADKTLVVTLRKLQTGFVNKNKQHIEFFGGHLTGVQVVRFTPQDEDLWFNLVLQSEKEYLEERLHSLDTINPQFHVSSDVMNLSMVYVLHKIVRSPLLNPQEKHEAMVDALLYIQFKFLTSLLFRYFRYPAEKSVAEATYARLSNKFSIKNYGSWIAVLKARSEDIISNSSIHYDAIYNMDSDEGVIRMVNDVQGRIRDMLKNIYSVFFEVHKEGVKISTTSNVVEHDGVETLKDQVKGLATYINYIKSIVSDRNSFIKNELIRVVEKIVPNAPPKYILSSLELISKTYTGKPGDPTYKLLEATILHSFSYISDNVGLMDKKVDIATLLMRLKGIYTSSRSTDPELLNLRSLAEDVIKKAVSSKTDAVLASVRTSVLLYIVARTYTMQYYSNMTLSTVGK